MVTMNAKWRVLFFDLPLFVRILWLTVFNVAGKKSQKRSYDSTSCVEQNGKKRNSSLDFIAAARVAERKISNIKVSLNFLFQQFFSELVHAFALQYRNKVNQIYIILG